MGYKNGRMVGGIQYFAVTQYLCFNNGRLVGGIQLVDQSCHIILSRTLSPYTQLPHNTLLSTKNTFHYLCHCTILQYPVTKYVTVTQFVFKQYPAFRYHLLYLDLILYLISLTILIFEQRTLLHMLVLCCLLLLSSISK